MMTQEQGVQHEEILKAIQEDELGDLNVLREFESEDGGKKKKKRAFTFRRTAIPRHLRERLDEGKLCLKIEVFEKLQIFECQLR